MVSERGCMLVFQLHAISALSGAVENRECRYSYRSLCPMNYLFTYLHSLDPDEREQLAHLSLRPRERETLDLLLEMDAAGEGARETVLERLAMSSTMFDKTCSMVLRQVYGAMVPEAGMALLGEPATPARLASLCVILTGIISLKIAS